MLVRHVASTDGVEVAVHDLGGPDDPSAPVLLLVHANGFCADVWRPLAAHLVDRFRCLAVDLRGHGQAVTPVDLDFDWAGFGDDVVAVLESDVLPDGVPVHGVGHSLGGCSLVLATARRPRVSSLWLYEPIIPPPGSMPDLPDGVENPMAAAALRRRSTFASVDAAIANYASKPPLSSLHPDALRAYVEHGFAPLDDGSITLRCRPEWEAAIFRLGGRHRAFADLPTIAVPVSVVMGTDADFGPAAFAPAVANALPIGYLSRHPDLGHFGPLEDPARLAAELRAFVE